MSGFGADDDVTDVLAAEEFGVPAPDPAFRPQVQSPADVLVAEEFGVPGADPAFRLRAEPATDVLAAEEFGMPAPDPRLHHEHLVLPEDLVGGEPRDVLVAEEFAMPAPDEAHVPPQGGAARGRPVVRLAVTTLPLLLGAVWRWRRGRRSKLSRVTRLKRSGLRRMRRGR